MKTFTGQELNGWYKIYGLRVGRVFIGLAIAKDKE